MPQTRNTKEPFIATGLELYEQHRDQPDVTDLIKTYVAQRYSRLVTRASRLSVLKKAIIDTYHSDGQIPDAVKALKLTDDQYNTIKTKQAKSLQARSKQCVEVDYGKYMDIVNTLRDSDDPVKLAVWLLAVTGRRSSEITNGKSTFTEVSRYVLNFDGQLKKAISRPYDIPTLAPAPDVLANYEKLHTMERSRKLYQSAIGAVVKELFGDMGITKPHMLRSIYAHAVYELFGKATDRAQHDYLSGVLGHAGYGLIPNYSCVKLTNVKRSFDVDDLKTATKADAKVAKLIADYYSQHDRVPSVNWLRKKGSSYLVIKRVLDANADTLKSL